MSDYPVLRLLLSTILTFVIGVGLGFLSSYLARR